MLWSDRPSTNMGIVMGHKFQVSEGEELVTVRGQVLLWE